MLDFPAESPPHLSRLVRELIAIDGSHPQLPMIEQPAKVLARYEEDGITFFTVERLQAA